MKNKKEFIKKANCFLLMLFSLFLSAIVYKLDYEKKQVREERNMKSLRSMGMSIEQIAEAVEEDISVVKEWIA